MAILKIDTERLRVLLWELHVKGRGLSFEDFCKLKDVLTGWQVLQDEFAKLNIKKSARLLTTREQIEIRSYEMLVRKDKKIFSDHR